MKNKPGIIVFFFSFCKIRNADNFYSGPFPLGESAEKQPFLFSTYFGFQSDFA